MMTFPLLFFQTYVHGNARGTEDQQQNHHEHHVGGIPGRLQDAGGVLGIDSWFYIEPPEGTGGQGSVSI